VAVISERVIGSAARRDGGKTSGGKTSGGKTSGGKTRAGVDILRRAIDGSERLHYASHRRGRSMSVRSRDSKGDNQEERHDELFARQIPGARLPGGPCTIAEQRITDR
jgi:hypothetical protein